MRVAWRVLFALFVTFEKVFFGVSETKVGLTCLAHEVRGL